MKRKPWGRLLVLAAAALLLGSCNFGDEPAAEPEENVPSTPVLPELVTSAEPYIGPEAGEYFNADTACALSIDGQGGFVLSTAGGSAAGTCSASGEELLFLCGGEEARAFERGGGIVFSGMAGIFLPAEERECFSELGVLALCDREYTDNGDGTYRLCDYGLEIALVYPDAMSAPENLIADAVVIQGGDMAYVTGRNVTEDYSVEAEKFMESYMRDVVPRDFRLLYGEEGEFEVMELLSEGVAGRIASAEGIIAGGEARIYVKCIMYTSTYSDGTVNYVCKCFFAPEGDERSFNALANSVVNMSAVRRR